MSRILPAVLLIAFAPALLQAQKAGNRDYLLSFTDASTETCGYKDRKGAVVIPARYTMCFTDTLRAYAFVLEPETGLMAIDNKGHNLYEVFVFDNGPDPASEGAFRILIGDKFGFADEKTGQVLITPQYDAAYPFKNGLAKVGMNCKTEYDGEHIRWMGGEWMYIDKTGKESPAPADGN